MNVVVREARHPNGLPSAFTGKTKVTTEKTEIRLIRVVAQSNAHLQRPTPTKICSSVQTEPVLKFTQGAAFL